MNIFSLSLKEITQSNEKLWYILQQMNSVFTHSKQVTINLPTVTFHLM
jgi:hypothetical protein